MKKFLPVIFVFLSYHCWSQGNMITINSTVPAQMTICGQAKVFTITIYNPSPFLLTNDTLKLTMPSGVAYQIGSVAGAIELYTSIPNRPVFLLPNISTFATLNISFSAIADCDIMAFISGGGIIENNIRVNYTANNTANYDAQTTVTYIVRQPSLSITTVANQSYTGSIEDVFTRCITIVNGGLGELSQFTLTDIHGSGLQVTAVSPGTWGNSGAIETIVLNGINFSSIGNGNNLFENGESITICETVHVLNCISVASTFEAYWGCNSQHCQSSISNANVVFPNLIPNLVITPNSGNIYAPMNSCIGQPSPQELKIENTGLGQATGVHLDIFQSTNSGYYPYLGSSIDETSFTIQVGSSAPIPITTDSALITNPLSCMSATAKGKVVLTIPTVNAGEIVYIRWNTYSCCYNACTGVGQNYFNGWRYSGYYGNICQSPYVIAESWGRVYSQMWGSLDNNSSISTLTSGQTGTFDFMFSSYGNYYSYPVSPSAYWKFVFTLPSCLVYSGNLHILSYDGINTWIPSSVSTSGNTVTAIFNGSAPFWLDHAEIMINLTVNCSGCSGSSGALGIQAYYIPDAACSCEVGIACQNASVSVLCPSPCPEGMSFTYFDFLRTSYGKPDNEPGGGNGIPDGSGSLDFTKIKINRAMFGDTIQTSFSGRVITSINHPSWQYCYAYSSISNGNLLSFIDAELLIYRGGSLLAACTNFTPVITTTGTTREFLYDLSAPTLIPSGCLPGGFIYLNTDSVVFKPRYKVTVNTQGPILSCYANNEYYLSDIAHPTSSADKYQCSSFNGNCSVMGYYFTTSGADNYSVKSCDNVVISENYYLSIGPCCSNYEGGNLFPYEYRNWAHIDTLTAVVPSGYDFISAQFIEYRTAGTLNYVASSPTAITPLNPNSSTLKFPVEQYFQGYGGVLPLSDDGFVGTLQVTLKPTCKVIPTISQGVRYDWTFKPTSFLTGPGSYPTFISYVEDHITYEAPVLFIQSSLPSVTAPNNTASWDVSISNTSNVSNALNTWLSGPTISGVSIIKLVDLGTSLPITPIGGIYQAGTVNASAVRNFRITATFTSCTQDSIIVYSGWNCNAGYPDSIQAYPCTPKSILLKLTPLMPALVVNITAPPSTIQLCDTAIYTLEGINVQLGTAYNVSLTATLPIGVSIIPGSCQFRYPVLNTITSIPDPAFMGGTTYQWDISTINILIHNNGLKGIMIPDSNSFKIIFKVTTNCGYTSGSTIAFNLNGKAACGLSTGQEVSMSSALGITGATAPYHANIKLLTTYISPCANNSIMKVAVQNQGPTNFSNADSVLVQLPVGVSFVNGSFTGGHNPPGNAVPLQFTLNGRVYLKWKLPTGIVVGDSSIFAFSYKGDPQALSCDITEFDAQTTSSTYVTCIQSGNSCGINIVTGDTALSVFTYKAYLSLSNGHATSIPNPPGGETVSVSLDITNTGQSISSGANSIIQFYYDANGNGIYNSGDVFLAQDSLLITNNSTVHYSNTFNVIAGKACSIIAIIDTSVNPCVCSPSQLLVHPPLISLGNDSSLCSGQTMTLSSLPTTGYTYTWSPTTNLSNSNISNPVLTASNITSAPISTDYYLTTNRMGCISKDTIKITVNPIPISYAGADIVACASVTPGNIGDASTAGYAYLWSPAAGLSNTTVSNPTVSLTNSGVISYIVTTSALGCSSKDTVVVTVNPIPVSNAGSDVAMCPYNTGHIGTASTPGYAYNWLPAIGLSSATLSNPTVTITNPSTTTYIVTTTALSCISKDTVVVTVNPIPISNAGADILTCATNISQNIGAAPVSGYAYLWSPATSLSDTTVSNPIVILTNAGITSYMVTTIALGCSSTDTVVVKINPVPSTGFTHFDVCFRDTMHFTNTSSVNLPASISGYIWDFGDGSSTSNLKNPTHYYSNYGTYNVTLVATTADLCSDAVTNSVNVFDSPHSAFTFTNTCFADSALFTNTTINPTMGSSASWSWNFGDSSPLNTTVWSPQHNYSIPGNFPGNYQVTLITHSSNLGCADTFQTAITIFPMPFAKFGFTNICLHQPMNFHDSSIVSSGSIAGWSWNFGDGPPLIASQHPSHTYANPGTYVDSLIVTTNNGCKDTAVKSVVVHPLPVVQFSRVNVCDGTPVHFTDQSSISPTDTIQSWKWNFGDNSPQSTNENSSHQYAIADSFHVQLLVVSKFGCMDSITKTSVVNPNPVVKFKAIDTIGCEPLCVSFQDLSVIATGGIVQWLWDFGDGSPVCHSKDFVYCYHNNDIFKPDTITVSLTATSDSGCVSIGFRNNFITVYPKPNANFTVQPRTTTVINPVISFVDLSTGANFWHWNFGDHDTSALSSPPSHTYVADTATYLITLITSTHYGCKDTAYQTVIIEPDFVFYIPNAFTPNDDGVNDYFFGSGVGIIKYDLWIFDRWGNLIFISDDISKAWDGKANHGTGIAQMDVYVWKVELTDVNNNKHSYNGTVTLLK